MRHIFLLLFSIAFTSTSYSQSYEDKIIGDWLTSNKDGIIRMHYGNEKGQDPEKIYGKLVWIEDPNNEDGTPQLDKENPEEELRDRPILGLTIIKDLEWNGNEDDWEWEDGSAYDPESGNTYSFQTEIDPEKPDVMNCRGFLGFSLLGRTEVWTRKK